MRTNSDDAADALLASLTIEQLRKGLMKGREQLALLDVVHAIDVDDMRDNIGHPGRHASKSYERWIENDTEFRRAHLNSAIKDVLAELARRGVVA